MARLTYSARLALYLTTIIILERAASRVQGKASPNATTPDSNSSIAVLSKTARQLPDKFIRSLHQQQPKQQPKQQHGGIDNHDQDDVSEDSAMYWLRIEMIKAKILAKLQMDKVPVIKEKPKESKIKELLASLNLIGEDDVDDKKEEEDGDYFGRTTKIIVFSEKVSAKVPASRSQLNSSRKLVFHFKLEQKTLASSSPSASLWIHMRKNKRHELLGKFVHMKSPNADSEGGPSDMQDVKVVKSLVKKEKKSGSGWVVLDITEVVKHWFNKTTFHHNITDRVVRSLEISCPDCESETSDLFSLRGRLRPFLVIDLQKPRVQSRRARSTARDCVGKTVSCCRRTLYVNFTKIGWDRWIMFPEGFYANYCEGSCRGRISPHNSYAFMLQQVMNRVNQQLTICCSPSKSSALSIFYFDEDNNIVKRNVQNMVVQECGCF